MLWKSYSLQADSSDIQKIVVYIARKSFVDVVPVRPVSENFRPVFPLHIAFISDVFFFVFSFFLF